jgi:long-subunit acyl-CoA synthetase (AMP-forming)
MSDGLTHRQAKIVAEFAAWLTAQGIEPGDHVAIAMRNYPEWMMAHWAVNSIGAAVVGMNAWWVADELDYALNDSKPKVLIADDRRFGGVCTTARKVSRHYCRLGS